MDSALIAGGVVGLALLTTFAVLLRSLVSTQSVETDIESSVLPDVRMDRYKSMAGLLSEEDMEFLKRQPGFTPAMGRRFRAERRQVMRAYLKSLQTDFATLHLAASQLLMVAPVDQPQLAHELMKQRWIFTRELALAHCNLTLDAMGMGTVRIDSLVSNLAKVQQHYSNLSNAIVMNAA